MVIRKPPPIPAEWEFRAPTQMETEIAASTALPPFKSTFLNLKIFKKIKFKTPSNFRANPIFADHRRLGKLALQTSTAWRWPSQNVSFWNVNVLFLQRIGCWRWWNWLKIKMFKFSKFFILYKIQFALRHTFCRAKSQWWWVAGKLQQFGRSSPREDLF